MNCAAKLAVYDDTMSSREKDCSTAAARPPAVRGSKLSYLLGPMVAQKSAWPHSSPRELTSEKSLSGACTSKMGITMAEATRLAMRTHHSAGLKGSVHAKTRSVTVRSVYCGRVVTTCRRQAARSSARQPREAAREGVRPRAW